jgi:xanthine dehydrogenase small subunit
MHEVPRIVLNGTPVSIDGVHPTATLLDWLRDHARLRGTKEGCAEGDCGACAVVVESLTKDGRIARCVINSCLTLVAQVDGWGIRTVEGLLSKDGSLHPVQSALAESGATQCGFCTPGFVMSAFAYAASGGSAEPSLIHDALAGNLCRCTGYRPIVDAIRKSVPLESDAAALNGSDLRKALSSLSRTSSHSFQSGSDRFYLPASFSEALELRAKFPDAIILAGGTDLGLLASQKRQKFPLVIHIGRLPELSVLEERQDDLWIGASVTYSGAFEFLTKYYPTLETYWARIGSPQIRNMGTIGGNIGTASSIGDGLPILLALGANISVSSAARGRRQVPAEQFFTGYRKTVLQADELIEAVRIPKPASGSVFFVDKISKRRDQDISALCGAYYLNLDGDTVREARIAFGGLAATPKRAQNAERALTGKRLAEDAILAAGEALAKDFQPLSDWRGSAEYRALVAKNLLRRLLLKCTQPHLLVECDGL